jgi:hypothetical protein
MSYIGSKRDKCYLAYYKNNNIIFCFEEKDEFSEKLCLVVIKHRNNGKTIVVSGMLALLIFFLPLEKAIDIGPIPQASNEISKNITRTAQEELVLELRCGASSLRFNQSHEEYLEKLLSNKLKSLDVEKEFERVLKLSEISKFKKFYRSIIVGIENSPELIQKSIVMLSQFEKPLPQSIKYTHLKLYDSLGILNRKSAGLIVTDVNPKPRYQYDNDFEFRLKQEKFLRNRRRLFSVGDSSLPAKKTNGGKNQENLLKPRLKAPDKASPLRLSISNSNEGVDIPIAYAYTNSDAISEGIPTSLTNIQARTKVMKMYGTKTNPKCTYFDKKIGLKAPYQVFANKAKHGLSYNVNPLLYYSESDLQILKKYGLIGYIERGCDFPSKAFTDTFFANSQSFYHRYKKNRNFHGAFQGKRAIIVHNDTLSTGGPALIFYYESKELWVPNHLNDKQMKRYLKTVIIGNKNQEVVPGTQPPLQNK